MFASPIIPDNAPFSTEQRTWLNGMLADIFAGLPQAATQTASLKIAIYFATQSGTAERLAKKLAKEVKAQGHTAEISSLEKTSPAAIAAQEHALFLVSTYGEGDPPDSAKTFRESIFSPLAPNMEKLSYSVFCLGDKNYEHFCKFGIELDERLESLGATRLSSRIESDVEVDVPFTQWSTALKPRFNKTAAPPAAEVTPIEEPAAAPEPAQIHTRENPFNAELRERWALTSGESSKQTIHLGFALEDSAVHYQAGDACGVVAQNDPGLVQDILALLPFDGRVTVQIPKSGRFTVTDALLHHLQSTRLTRRIVQSFAEKAQCKKLLALLPSEESEKLEAYMHGRGLIDLLIEYPGVIASPDDLVAVLPRLAPRLYSISSSPAAHGRSVHCTVAVVRYRSHNRDRGGVASTMLGERVKVGSRLPIYIHPNKKFRLPVNGDTPIIMIGPGTGIAPFRAFLHERQALGHRGRNWLFFGERSASTDFLYNQELRSMTDSGHLTRLDTAFSRDQAHKVYVQDRMRENGAELWRWLNDGAQVFVCGDASRMAKDVDSALHQLIEQHGQMDNEAARDYVTQLQEDRRYHRDVY